MKNKYIPTGDMSGEKNRLEITLSNVLDRVIATGRALARVSGWAIDSVELIFEYVELKSSSKMISAQNARAT